MKNTILVPLDGTESRDEILAYAQAIGSVKETGFTLLYVSPETDSAEPLPTSPPDFLQLLIAPLTAAGLSVNTELRTGDAVDEIIKLANSLSASMVLMSTHGRTGLDRIREGSVTENVLKRSPCPVFILHSTRPEPADQRSADLFRRILVPLDGSDDSSAILGCVKTFAKTHASEVVLFHDETGMDTDYEPTSAIKTREQLEEVGIPLANAGLKVSFDWKTSKRPIREILSTIDELKVDLVAMATHGRDRKCRILEESVTAEVIRFANCPLLVWSVEPRCD
jgi:nucleotide-binding universal stress UspA family protein